MRISDWSSDVCSSDLHRAAMGPRLPGGRDHADDGDARRAESPLFRSDTARSTDTCHSVRFRGALPRRGARLLRALLVVGSDPPCNGRSEEHTSELQSLMRISYAVFCLKKKNNI